MGAIGIGIRIGGGGRISVIASIPLIKTMSGEIVALRLDPSGTPALLKYR